MSQRFSAQQWARWFEDQRSSGLPHKKFCESIGVSLNSFYRWRKKLRLEAVGQPSAVDPGSDQPDFVPLSIATFTTVEIDLPCGATMRVPGDASSLRQVLGVLFELGVSPQ